MDKPKKKTRKKPRYRVMRFRKNDPAHNLIAAAQRWLISKGCPPVIIGPIGLLPEGNPMKFHVTVGALGRMPTKTEKPA